MVLDYFLSSGWRDIGIYPFIFFQKKDIGCGPFREIGMMVRTIYLDSADYF